MDALTLNSSTEMEDEENEARVRLLEKAKIPALADRRHLEVVKATQNDPQLWRIKDKLKTFSVAIVLCLNLPVDPPDVIKLNPCSKHEAWIDPTTMTAIKAIEAIGHSLQKAYEKGQPKARYKISQDPTVEELKRLCMQLRRNAKEERVLFHYNGHGVPKPTDNGEIWVFNSNYTQYIPLSVYDVQQWMGSPSVYVYDCSNAGRIVKFLKSFTSQYDELRYIQLGACGEKELLPQNPDLPADLFTSCLTTPIKMAVRYYFLQMKNTVITDLTFDMLDKVPGQLNDRRSMLGELNWIYTAITDTIAWNCLPRDLFQKLFRQDLLVASLFRNFLLAQRIMHSYDCMPVSSPSLPATYHSHLWSAWDFALERILSQLPSLVKLEGPESIEKYIPSKFFEDQLKAFQLWLRLGSVKRPPPEQLPMVLQVLLSQVYRPLALKLLGTFLELGPWAVNLVLEVGTFPYILRLLQSTAKELRPMLTLMWAKILAVDQSCKQDLIKENASKYFTNILKDTTMSAEYRAMATFIMSVLVHNGRRGQTSALQIQLLPSVLEILQEPYPLLKQWSAICAGRIWETLPMARWEATRDNGHEKLIELLNDPVPEVRAAVVFALGTFIQALPATDVDEQGRSINFNIGVALVERVPIEASPLVRRELVVSIHYLLVTYENIFCEVTREYYATINSVQKPTKNNTPSKVPSSSSMSRLSSSPRNSRLSNASSTSELSSVTSPASRRSSVHSNVSVTSGTRLSHGKLHLKIWTAFAALEKDPDPYVSDPAKEVVLHFQKKVFSDEQDERSAVSPIRQENTARLSVPITRGSNSQNATMSDMDFFMPIVGSNMVDWCSRVFIQSAENDEREKNFFAQFVKSPKPDFSYMKVDHRTMLSNNRFDEQLFAHRLTMPPSVLMFHPTKPLLMVAEKKSVSIWDIESSSKKHAFMNGNEGPNQITSMASINSLHENSYLAIGCNDGSIRIWRECFKPPPPPKEPTNPNSQRALNRTLPQEDESQKPARLVTGFKGLEDVGPSKRGSGLLMSWEQTEKMMIVAGDSKVIRLWDMHREMFLRDIQTDATCTTSLHSQEGHPWIVAGFSDGFVRLFDRRISNAIARQWRDKNGCVLMTHLINPSSASTQLISGLDTGEVRLHDLRRTPSVPMKIPLPENYKALVMSYHSIAHVFALGSIQNQILLGHTLSQRTNVVRHYSGFVGQKIGPVNCLAFHPTELKFAAGTTDGMVSIHNLIRR